MLALRHLLSLLRDMCEFAMANRSVSLLLTVLLGMALVLIGAASQAAAPFVVYPFV